ncbi:YihY/virulence factor BrkB family protein [Kineococcus sp. G2]|uniref:YihY/virulence factor BrkB family protein n=1 Tax=Kineococcus sp. G2 TaxID=3127484 RepID=UPI00301E4C49
MPEDPSRPAGAHPRPSASAAASVASSAVRSAAASAARSGRVRGALSTTRELVAGTVGACLRFRITGLAAEGGFFALLSLPPLVFGLVASLGYVGRWLGRDEVTAAREQLTRLTEAFFTPEAIDEVLLPTFDSVTTAGRADLTLLAFGFSVWSGSRALNVYVDTISIMYGLGGHRGIVRTRLLSLGTYLAGLLAAVVVLPLLLVGPRVVGRWLPPELAVLSRGYWPVVLLLSVFCLATLYHLATPVRSRWWRDLPGAVLALLLWLVASSLLRPLLSASVGGTSTSIYGPLAAPIVVLVWFYVLAIAVLAGAALNAAADRVWPDPGKAAAREAARAEAVERRRWVP